MSCVSGMTLLFILNYLDPYEYKFIGIVCLTLVFVLFCSSVSALVLYVIKKIYFRGSTSMIHVLSSFRQGSFLSFYGVTLVAAIHYGLSIVLVSVAFFVLVVCMELFLHNTHPGNI
ncbi:hypothetical protein MK079_03995 [Candidatus Gracilibacteria bacterium]|nr:hypothetical protein [Candidatus Gracilibacteria bacterium]